MTRLTEALERAGAAGANGAGTAGNDADHPPEFVREWELGDDDLPAAAAVQLRPALAPPPDADETLAYHFAPRSVDKVVVGAEADSALVEQYRRLAAVLHNAQLRDNVHSVMIASAVAAEGKTLTATNLALTLSHSYQRRVLLIDADLRRPSVHEVFQLPNDNGLGESLRQRTDGRLPVRRVSPTLWVLTAGHPTSDPMSGLVSETMKQLLSDAVAQFDWVIVDTPPVALMADANLLARMIDGALLVVSASSTPYPLVKRAVEAIGASRIFGVVLNRAERSAFGSGYGYGYYGYYYSYYGKSTPARRSWLSLFRKQH